MSSEDDGVWRRLEAISTICAELAAEEDDAVRMFAQRVDALSKAFRDSVLVPPAGDDGGRRHG